MMSRRSCQDSTTRNWVLALQVFLSIVPANCYLGRVGGKEVLSSQVVAKGLPPFHPGSRAAKSVLPVPAMSVEPFEVQGYSMLPSSRGPGTSTVQLLSAIPLPARSAKMCGTHRQDPSSPRIFCQINPQTLDKKVTINPEHHMTASKTMDAWTFARIADITDHPGTYQ
mmetsp:Transcript_16018/g.23582  ORF Transcript_16018/g.23582 Transcript_16018/m.23582 type:complete len:168 (+) Transcript_16018:264-767(+)